MKWLVPALAITAIVVATVTFVALTLRQPSVPTYAPTPPTPREAGAALVGPILYTVDATAPEAWQAFSFRLGSVIDAGQGDLAFRRYSIVAGLGAGIRDLGEAPVQGRAAARALRLVVRLLPEARHDDAGELEGADRQARRDLFRRRRLAREGARPCLALGLADQVPA